MEREGGTSYLEDISHCDLVEKFQLGCLDYTSDSLVTSLRHAKGGGRAVTAVIERKLSESTIMSVDPVSYAYEEYEKIKYGWGERPNIWWDYVNGRLHSEVLCVVHPLRSGFGRYTKIPNRVVWRVYSSKPIVKKIGSLTVVRKDFGTIEVPVSTDGKYSDYTYGLYLELDPREDVALLKIGLAYLMIVLRRAAGIKFDTIK